MVETDLPWVFTERLERAGVAYMIVGAFATLAFGVYRTTDDLDLVLSLAAGDLKAFEDAFPDKEFYRPPRETLLEELRRPERGHFNLIHNGTLNRADCYLIGRDALQLWGLRNRHPIDLDGRRCWVAPPEVVILKKLEFYREGGSEKHVRDIRGVLEVAKVDRGFIDAHVERLGLRDQWALCQTSGE